MRAAFITFALLGFVVGCSDSSPSRPPNKSSTVLPGTKDKEGGTGEPPAPTRSDDKAVQLLDEAIKAHGGAEALGKLAAIERSVKGTYAAERREVEFNADSLFQLPGRLKTTISLDLGEVKASETIVLDGNQGWQLKSGEVNTLGDPRVQELREQLYAYAATTLLPLREANAVVVVAADDSVEGKPASVIRAFVKERPEVRLYFDKASKLLVKIAYRAKLAGGVGDMEIRLFDIKEVDGAKVPHRQAEYLNGGKVAEWSLVNLRVARRFDGGTFAKPQ